MGGLFRRLETASNDLDQDFDRQSLRLRRFFCPHFDDLQKKKGGGSSMRFSRFFLSKFR